MEDRVHPWCEYRPGERRIPLEQIDFHTHFCAIIFDPTGERNGEIVLLNRECPGPFHACNAVMAVAVESIPVKRKDFWPVIILSDGRRLQGPDGIELKKRKGQKPKKRGIWDEQR